MQHTDTIGWSHCNGLIIPQSYHSADLQLAFWWTVKGSVGVTFTYNAVRSEWVNHCSSRLTVSQNVVYRYYVVGSEWVNLIRSPISLLLSMKVQQLHTHKYCRLRSKWVNHFSVLFIPVSVTETSESVTVWHTNTVGSGENGFIIFQSYLLLSVSLKYVTLTVSHTNSVGSGRNGLLWLKV